MPKIVDYPRASLRSALNVAEAVNALGGSCTMDMAAHKVGQTVSGAFKATVSAASKYGFIDADKGKLAVQDLFRQYKLAYSEDEQKQVLRRALLNPPLFQEISRGFSGRTLPVEILDKLLQRELSVPEAMASRVSGYFLEGASASGLLGEGGVLRADSGALAASEVVSPAAEPSPQPTRYEPTVTSGGYVVTFSGPGMNSSFEVADAADLVIIDAVLKKIRAKLQQSEGGADEPS